MDFLTQTLQTGGDSMKDMEKKVVQGELDKIGDKIVGLKKDLKELLEKIQSLEEYVGDDKDEM